MALQIQGLAGCVPISCKRSQQALISGEGGRLGQCAAVLSDVCHCLQRAVLSWKGANITDMTVIEAFTHPASTFTACNATAAAAPAGAHSCRLSLTPHLPDDSRAWLSWLPRVVSMCLHHDPATGHA